MNIGFLKTIFFLNFFLFFTSSLSAQENTPVKIESPTSDLVSRSFTITGSAQAGAKLHLTINGKTFGRYRATIEGKFTIGVSVPENELFIELKHIVDGRTQSEDSIRVQVGDEKTLKRIEEARDRKESEEKASSQKKRIKALDESDENEEKILPSAGKIPTKPNSLKKQYSEKKNSVDPVSASPEDPDAFSIEARERDPVVLNKKNNPYSTQNVLPEESVMSARLLMGTVGLFVVTAGLALSSLSFVDGNIGVEDTLVFLVVAELAIAPVGVYFGSNFAGGKADLWAVYLGELVGLFGSLGFILAANSAPGDLGSVFALLAVMSPFAGMFVGYEISHAANTKKSGKVYSMQPTVQISDEVRSVGLRLRF